MDRLHRVSGHVTAAVASANAMNGNKPMKNLSGTRELQPLVKPAFHRVNAPVTAWDWIVATVTDPNLAAVVLFCGIGLLIAFNLILHFPAFGAIIAQYNQF
jgi:hypothetical protein